MEPLSKSSLLCRPCATSDCSEAFSGDVSEGQGEDNFVSVLKTPCNLVSFVHSSTNNNREAYYQTETS